MASSVRGPHLCLPGGLGAAAQACVYASVSPPQYEENRSFSPLTDVVKINVCRLCHLQF